MERTRSKFLVLQTPVTSVPKDLAICTAKVPTPPDAPLIRTFCPGLICPLLRRPRSEEHTSELQSLRHLVCRLLLEKQKEQCFYGPVKFDSAHGRPRITSHYRD